MFLSSDDSPGSVVIIADEPNCCNAFLEPGDGVTQTSLPQNLTAGKNYFIQALMKEGGGGDYVKVAWRKSGDTTPAASLQPIPGEFLSVYRSAAPVIVEPPAFTQVTMANGQVTIAWTGSATLQESTDLKTWTAVTGNPSGTYTVAASGSQKFYRLVQ